MTLQMPVTAATSLCLPAGADPYTLGPLLEEATGGLRVRRVNRFIELALIGAHRCRGADIVNWPQDQPLVIATGQGNIADTNQMLESVIGAGNPPMPFQFINLAGNMAGFHLAQSLGAVSANTTVSQLDFPLEAALHVAVEEYRRAGAVLVGAVDELAWPLEDHRVRLGCAAGVAVGEGSHWLRIGDGPALGWIEPPCYCTGEAALAGFLEQSAASEVVRTSVGVGTDWSGVAGDCKAAGYPVHDTLAAAVICEFLAGAGPGRVLAHVSHDGAERYAVIRAGTGAPR